MSKTLHNKMQEIKVLLDDGILSQEEFDQEKKKLLAQWQEGDGELEGLRSPPTINLLSENYELGAANARFKLIERIGVGSYGQVWKAIDLSEKQLTGESKPIKALKFLNEAYRDTPEQIELLKKEAIKSRKLAHENIVNVTQFVEGSDGWIFIVMEYLEGESLNRYIHKQKGKCLVLDEAIRLLKPVAKALDYTHKKGIYHRDLKPANIFLTTDDEVKILDFGLAYQIRRSSNIIDVSTEALSGTVEYMAPEVFLNDDPKPTHDIHALAIVMYELLNGKPPFNPEKSIRRDKSDTEPYRPKSISDKVWQAVKQGFSHHINDRPKTAMAYIANIEQAQKEPEKKPKEKKFIKVAVPVVIFIGVSVTALIIANSNNKLIEERPNINPPATSVLLAPELSGSSDGKPQAGNILAEENVVNPENSGEVLHNVVEQTEEINLTAENKQAQATDKNSGSQTTGGVSASASNDVKDKVDDSVLVVSKVQNTEDAPETEKNKLANNTKARDPVLDALIDKYNLEVGNPVLVGEKDLPDINNTPLPSIDNSNNTTTGYSIQLLATGSKSKAEAVKRQMIDQGYPAYIISVIKNGKTLYRTRIGSYQNQDEAYSVQARMKRRYTKNSNVQNSLVVAN